MASTKYKLECAWNGSQYFGGASEDLTADLFSVECRRGRDYASQLTGRCSPGKLNASLKNISGKYSSYNSSSPIYGNILPGRKTRLSALSLVEGSALTLESPTTNLLTAGVEDFSTGWLTVGGETITVTPGQTDPFGGSNAYRIQGLGNGSSIIKWYCLSTGRTNPHTDTCSVWAKVLSGNAKLSLDGAGTGATVLSGATWLRYSNTKTQTDTDSAVAFLTTATSDALDIVVYFPQIENKPYATSYIAPGSSRIAETLTIPTASVLDAGEGTMECWIKPLRSPGTIEQVIFDAGGDVNENMEVYIGTDGKLNLRYGTGAATVTLTGTTTLVADTWYAVAWKWSASGVSLWLNGAQEDSDATAPGMTFGATASFGKDLSVTNIVTEGNFPDTSSWTAFACSLSAASNTLSITGDGTQLYTRVYQDLGVKPLNSKIYFAAKVRVTNSSCTSMVIRIRDGAAGTIVLSVTQNTPTANTWYLLSGIASTTSLTNNIYLLIDSFYADAATQNGKVMEVQQAIAVNVTNLSTAQQTTTWCDANLTPWFDGTTTLYPRLDGLLDDVRLSNAARTTILTDYNNSLLGIPFPVDEYTTCKLNFDDSLSFEESASTATFARNSLATKIDGTSVTANNPRYETGYINYWIPLWTGYLDRLLPSGSVSGTPTVQLEATGPISRIANKKVTVVAQTSQTTGTIIDEILDDAGWASADRTLDTGQTTIDAWFVSGIDALNAVREVEETELGFFTESADGKLVFEDRHHRLISPHTTSQQTYSDASGASMLYNGIEQMDPIGDIYNDITAMVTKYTTAGSAEVLWTLDGTPTLAPGESGTYWAEYPNTNKDSTTGAYVSAWDDPVVGTDITQTGVSNSDIAVTVTKFSNTMKIVITNNNATSTATLTLVQAQGTKVTKNTSVGIASEDSTSQGKYGKRSYELPSPWLQSANTAQDYTNYIVGRYKNAVPVISLTYIANKSAAALTEMLTRDISDRITAVATGAKTELGLDGDFFVESVQHRILNAGLFHEVKYDLSDASGDGGWWILGISELGVNTRLAY